MKHLSSSHVSVPILSFPSLFLCVLSKTHSYSIYLSQPSLYLYPILIFSRSITACSKRARKERAGIEKKERREEKRGEKEKDMRRIYREYMFTWISVFKPLLLPLLLPLFPLSNKCQSMQTRCLNLLLPLFSLLLWLSLQNTKICPLLHQFIVPQNNPLCLFWSFFCFVFF